jgi:hypothetical protein
MITRKNSEKMQCLFKSEEDLRNNRRLICLGLGTMILQIYRAKKELLLTKCLHLQDNKWWQEIQGTLLALELMINLQLLVLISQM